MLSSKWNLKTQKNNNRKNFQLLVINILLHPEKSPY